ncbi:LacI family DNA-binding transcriptional regulator [Paenibacillus luteus]|uniref:LacI family DNA-binding transcriptional regulator n=1 Tax=Paenibacillus luteus TaxID=2545753 RepID=UPI0011412929|nr:LacI family DNA-binding transcriptional regulator [Paenibacillus luteus]
MGKLVVKKTTIYDIAKFCGVSPATVSRVLSNSNYPVSEETKKKILHAAKVLKYIPNLIGKNLKTDQNHDIGVVIPNMSNYYSTLLRGIQDVALKYDSQIILCNSYRDVKVEEKNVNLLLQKQVKGILIASIDDSGEVLRQIIDKNVAVVAMEQDVKAECNRTGFNFTAGASLATEHLIECGHSNIGFVTAPLLRMSRKKLLAGYKLTLLENGISINEDYIYVESHENDDDERYDFMIGKRAADYFLSLPTPPTAVFCFNDMAAIGLIRRLQEKRISVPEDMAVVGFDNIPFTEMTTPSITTIDQSTFDLGHLSADLLFKNIVPQKQNSLAHVSMQLEPKLVIRESTTARK